MNNKKSKFVPNEELVEFAHSFSDNFKELKVGTYVSDNDKYKISYLSDIRDNLTKNILTTNARIGHTSKLVELDKKKLIKQKVGEDYVFFIILWCFFKVNNPNMDAYSDADIETFRFYSTTGRPYKKLILDFIGTLKHAPTELNAKRVKIIMDIIHKKQKNKKNA